MKRPRRRQAAPSDSPGGASGPAGDEVPSPARSPAITRGPGASADTTTLGDEAAHPKSLLPGCLLLLLAEQPGHGYDLAERLGTFGPGWAREPVQLYRHLRKLETDGLIVSVWEASQTRGPARRVYDITPDGREALRSWGTGVGQLVEALDEVLSRHNELVPPATDGRRRRRQQPRR